MQPTIHRSERICIDISDNVVSIIKLDPEGIMMRAGSAKAPTMPSVPDDAYVTDLSSAIRKAAWAAKVSMGFGASCVIVSGMPEAVIQRFTWPDMPEDVLLSIAQEEMIPYLPGNPAHYTIGCEVLKLSQGDGSGPAMLEVLAAAMPIEHTAAITTACKWANFKPKRMDLRENARGRLAHYWCAPVEGEVPTTYAILDVAPGFANIAFYYDGMFHSNRYFTPEMVKLNEVDDFELLMTVKGGGVDDNENAMRYNPDRLAEDIVSAISHFQRTVPEARLSCILLMDDENIPGIEDSLRANLNMLVLKPSQWVSPGLKRPSLRRIDQVQFLDAFAAGMPPLSNHGSRMDLRISNTPTGAVDTASYQPVINQAKKAAQHEHVAPTTAEFSEPGPLEGPIPARAAEPRPFDFDRSYGAPEPRPLDGPLPARAAEARPSEYSDPYTAPEQRPYDDTYSARTHEQRPYDDPYSSHETEPYEDTFSSRSPEPARPYDFDDPFPARPPEPAKPFDFDDPYTAPEPMPYEDPFPARPPEPARPFDFDDPYAAPDPRPDPYREPDKKPEPVTFNFDDPYSDGGIPHKPSSPEPVMQHEFPFDPIKAQTTEHSGFPYAIPEDPRPPRSLKPLIAAVLVAAAILLVAVLIPFQENLALRSDLQYLENSISAHVSAEQLIIIQRDHSTTTSHINAMRQDISRLGDRKVIVRNFYLNPPAMILLPEVLEHAGLDGVNSIVVDEHTAIIRGRTNALISLPNASRFLREDSRYSHLFGVSFDVDPTPDNTGVDAYGYATYMFDISLHQSSTPFWLNGHTERRWP